MNTAPTANMPLAVTVSPIRNKDLELKRLEKRIEELQKGNEILKKFQAFWKEAGQLSPEVRSEADVPPSQDRPPSLLHLD